MIIIALLSTLALGSYIATLMLGLEKKDRRITRFLDGEKLISDIKKRALELDKEEW